LNVNKVLTKDYDQMDTWSIRKKQSQTNPNKAKFKKAKMNVTSILTKGYENKPPIRAPKKQTQPVVSLSNLFKPNLSRRSLWRSRNLSRRSLWRRRKQTQFHTNLGRLKLISTSQMIKSFLNIVGPPRVIVVKTGLTIRKAPPGISRAKTGNRVHFRN
jgi:hypothetical protein